MDALNGILSNHQVPVREETLVTRKITRVVAEELASTYVTVRKECGEP